MESLNSILLGSFPAYEAPEGVVGLNRFRMTTGASRYGVGQFVMRQSDYRQLTAGGGEKGDGTALLTMKGFPGPGLSLRVLVAGAEPISTSTGSDPASADTGDVVKVTVYDRRTGTLFNPIRKAYNVMKDGFPLSSGLPDCWDETLTGDGPDVWSWEDLLKDLSLVKKLPDDLPDWTPYNLIWDGVAGGRVIDDIAARLFYVVGYDWQADHLTLDSPGDSNQANSSLGDDADFAVTGGAAGLRVDQRLPGKLEVTFQGFNADNVGGSPFVSAARVYKKSINTGVGTPDKIQSLHCGEMIGVYKGGAFGNLSELDDAAADLVPRAIAFMQNGFATQEYAGIWPFQPDGFYREVTWISDRHGARTIVRNDNRKDFDPTKQYADPIDLPGNQETIGLGGANSTIAQSGTRYVWASGGGGLFPCTVTKIAGTDGNLTTAPSYTYDFFDIKTGKKINTSGGAQGPKWIRDNPVNGTFLPANDGTYYTDQTGNPILYEANEAPNTIGCGSS